MSALLERRALDPDLLWDKLPPYVPPALRRSITTTYTTLEYHLTPLPTRDDMSCRDDFSSPSGDGPSPTKVPKAE